MSPKANNFFGQTEILVSWLVFIISFANSIHSAQILSSKLHCSSTVFLHKTILERGTLVSYENTHFEEYQVVEYLDLKLNRSSVWVFDVNKNEHGIYYNSISPNEQRPARQLVFFKPIELTCEEIKISDWLLANLRWTMIGLRFSMSEISRERVDVPIGPSGMLYTVEDTLEQYLYVGTINIFSRLTLVDVFSKSFVYNSAEASKLVTIIVQVASRGNNDLKPNDPLSKVYDKAQEIGTDPSAAINIVMIGACDMTKEGDAIDRVSPLDKDPNADLQMDENTFCKRQRTLFVIHYNFVATYSAGSLVGSPIEELSESGYDFNREPLMMPTSIGCWGENEALSRWQKRLTRDNPMSQFSGEYVTTHGSSGVSFMAFDQQRGLVRLDRNGRKSVYDLIQGKSYHVGEFKQPHEVNTLKMSQADKYELEDEEMVRRCVALDTSSSSQIVSNKLVAQQLLGLRPNSGEEHYLGSRMIDHVNYEVFEIELQGENRDIPLILQFDKIGLPTTTQRLFLTYYAQSIVESSSKRESLLLRYIELWEFGPKELYRNLLNRVELTEFSWQLDVEPTNDPMNQHSDSLSVRLFDFEECYYERSAQAEILVDFERNKHDTSSEGLLEDLRNNRHAIAETIQSMLAQTLELSALNIVDFKLRSLENGDLLTSAKIVDLFSGLTSDQRLGYGLLFSSPIFDGKIKRTFHARYTLEECQLDSIAWSEAHFSAFCPQIAICALLEPSEQLKLELEGSQEDKTKYDNCYFYSFRHSNHMPSRSATHAAEMRSVDIARRSLEFDLENGIELIEGHKSKSTYVATPKLREFKLLDAIGARLTNNARLFGRTRYLVAGDNPNLKNLNTRVHIPRESQLGTFRFCQLACQMDDLCGSFSVCIRRQNKFGDTDECVLSSMRLNAERINELAYRSMIARKENHFALDLGPDKQKLVMHYDEECSLHSKDFVADYESTKTFIKLGDTKQYERNERKSQPEKGPLEKRHLSLDDCAGLSYEKTMNLAPINASFTYCPLDSNCIVFGDDQEAHMDAMNGYCHVYKRRLTRPYDVRCMTHMVLTRRNTFKVDRGKDEKGAVKKLDPMVEAERMETQNLVKKLWGLDEQSCAQECNLRRTNCLAFDSCRQSGQVLCVLFSIRSPLDKTTELLAQLEVERQTYRDHNVELLNSLICDHFHLKPDYLEVRLKHLLELEGAVGNSPSKAIAERDKFFEEREKAITSEDAQKSYQQDSRLELELAGKRTERGSSPEGESHANKWFHFGALLVGLLLGAVGTTYNKQIAHAIASGYSWYQIRRAHNSDCMMNRLVLDDPITT